MAYSHLGHNCHLGDRIVVANNVAIAGHVVIGDRAVIGGVLGIHQFVHIGKLAMVGGMSRIDRDIPPFMIVEGHPGRLRGLNRIGLKRSGLSERDGGEQLRQLQEIWNLLYRSELVLADALQQARQLPLLPAADELCGFLEASISPGRRGPLPAQRS
jgi:UDP-N-acetylglucosamine acyltransferase